MRYLYAVAAFAAIGNSIRAWDGALTDATVGWGVAAMMFIAATIKEHTDA